MDSYSEGSVWRRWDLHVHTPETNKNDQFEGRTPKENGINFMLLLKIMLEMGLILLSQ